MWLAAESSGGSIEATGRLELEAFAQRTGVGIRIAHVLLSVCQRSSIEEYVLTRLHNIPETMINRI